MKVIGISGLENSMAYKKAKWPGLEEREYRIAQGMDAAAALVIDGKLVAAAEQERFSGKKHTGDFPIDAINFCLAEAGLTIDDIDEIAHGFDYAPYRTLYQQDEVSTGLYDQVFSKEVLLNQVKRDLPTFPLDRVHQVGHHLAHESLDLLLIGARGFFPLQSILEALGDRVLIDLGGDSHRMQLFAEGQAEQIAGVFGRGVGGRFRRRRARRRGWRGGLRARKRGDRHQGSEARGPDYGKI